MVRMFVGNQGKGMIVQREDRVQQLVEDFQKGYLTRR
jgi:hypothetical protein